MRGFHTANRPFAGANKDDVRVTVGDINGAYTASIEITIRDIFPDGAGTRCPPEAAAGGAKIVGQRVVFDAGYRGYATTAEGADASEFQGLVQFFIHCFRSARRDCQAGKNQN